ncbi:MAG TPA: hypothetical protein VJM53_10595 [Burkholderiales bacterium]|jgi:hypothetical protein|nr:hypothetical protein [Burkholderiales bacterium]
MSKAAERVKQHLLEAGYARLFIERVQAAIDQVRAGESDIGSLLQEVANDRETSWDARFLASEYLYRYIDMKLHAELDRDELQESYFEALRHNASGNGADWAFATGPNELGPLLRMVLDGDSQLNAFLAGLEDDTELPLYFPWRAPAHFEPPYRVKDFAALAISRVRGLGVDLSGPVDRRDEAIESLRKRLAEAN